MICYASSSLFAYNILKLMTYHTPFYGQPTLSYQRSNRSGFFGPPCKFVYRRFYVFVKILFVKRDEEQYTDQQLAADELQKNVELA